MIKYSSLILFFFLVSIRQPYAQEVTWYTVKPLPDAVRIAEFYKSRNPKAVVNVLRGGGGGRLATRVITENRAGANLFDVLTIEISSIPSLKSRSIFAAMNFVESENFPSYAVDAERQWVGFDQNPLTIAYNTKFVSQKQRPRSWEDLLEVSWKGKIAAYESEFKWYGVLRDFLGREKAKEYLQKLAKQDIRWVSSHQQAVASLLSGESQIALVFAYRAEVLKNAGAPIDWADDLNPIPTSYDVTGIAKKALHPEAAHKFANFLLSRDCQEYISSIGRMPLRKDVKPISERLDHRKMKLAPFRVTTEQEIEDLAVEFRKLTQK